MRWLVAISGLVRKSSLALACALVVGCGTSDEASNKAAGDCVPGLQAACACPNGLQGIRICDASGTAYSQCACPQGQAGSGVGGFGGAGGTNPAGGTGNIPGTGGSDGFGGSVGTAGTGTGGTGTGGSGTGGTGTGGSGVGGFGGAGGSNPPPPPPDGEYAASIRITEVAIYQGVKVQIMQNGQPVTTNVAKLVEGRDALVRVFVEPLAGWQNREVSARLDLTSSDPSVQSQGANKTVAGASSDADLNSTFNFKVPGAQVTGDLQLAVSIREIAAGGGGTVDPAVVWPTTGAHALSPQDTGASLQIVIVPFRYNYDGSGRLPDTSQAQMQRYYDTAWGMYPTKNLILTVRTPVDYSAFVGPSSGWSGWLESLCDVRQSDNVDSRVYYYGTMAPKSSWSSYGGGIAGLGNVPSATSQSRRCSVGLGFSGADTNGLIMVHEVGHTLGRPHAPCGVQDSGSFPYSNATLGTWGYDLVKGTLKNPSTHRDVMSYCDPQWISDYNFDRIFTRIQTVNQNGYMKPLPERTYRKLLVDVDGSVSWGKTVKMTPYPDAQKRRITLLDSSGHPAGTIEGEWHEFSEAPAGVLFVPDPPPGISTVVPQGMQAVALP